MKKQVICNEDGQQQLNYIKDTRTLWEKVFQIDFSGHMRHF